jgi:hypothetical protein
VKVSFSFSFSFSFFFFCYIHSTNYKNSKLNKNYIKQFKIYKKNPLKQSEITGMAFCKPEQCGPTRRCRQTRTLVGSGSTPSPLPFCAASEEQRHLQRRKKRKPSLGSSPFSNLFLSLLSLFISVFLLLVSPALF